MDQFEEHIQGHPLNGPPAEWRTGILETARQCRAGILPGTDRIAENDRAENSTTALAVGNDISPREGISGDQTLKPAPPRRVTPWMPVLRGWLWPHPGAWAGLTVIWLFLFLMQHQMNVEIQEEMVLAGIKPPSTNVMVAMEQHRVAIERLLAMNNFAQPVIDRPKRSPVLPTNYPPLMLLTP